MKSILASVLALLLFAVPARAQTVTIALGAEPVGLDPQLHQDGAERNVGRNIFETLLAREPDGTLVPGLAAALPEQIDPLTWRFRLRPNIRFHNGEAFNAQAVATSVKRIVAPAFASRQRPFLTTIVDARVVDDLTVDIITNGPDPSLPTRMYWLTIVPASVSPEINARPIGTGPFRFVSWNRGQSIVLERNADYWRDNTNIRELRFRFVPEAGTRLAGLRAGDFDLILNLQPEDAPRAPQTVSIPSVEVSQVSINADLGMTQDIRVRQALNYAIDKQAIVDQVFGGFATLLQGQMLADNWLGHNPDLRPWPYDPARARALLREAGVAGRSIDLVASNGRWLKDRELAEVVASFWEAAGLRVNLRVVPWPEYLDNMQNRRVARPAAIIGNPSNQLFDADRSLTAFFHTVSGQAGIADAALSAAIERARHEVDAPARLALYHAITRDVNERALQVWLVRNNDIYGLSRRLVWQPRADGLILAREMRVR